MNTCGHDISSGHGTKEGTMYCYSCCAEQDKESLRQGENTLYLSKGKLTNWPASLVIEPTKIKEGKHNIARIRRDVWFTFEGKNFHGVQYGDSSELCRVKALKT